LSIEHGGKARKSVCHTAAGVYEESVKSGEAALKTKEPRLIRVNERRTKMLYFRPPVKAAKQRPAVPAPRADAL
jgi:hypothetical protein